MRHLDDFLLPLPMTSMCRPLLALFLASLGLACQPNEYGPLKPGPKGIVETPVADYPFGDAVDVYRAALDLLYKEGSSRPGVIVLRDSAILRYGGPCPQCPRLGPHKARIDTSTIEGFASIPPVKPRTRRFAYDVPIALLTNADLDQMRRAAQVYDSIHSRHYSPRPGEIDNGYDREFLRRYPGAWGWLDLSIVGFNKPHTEALLEVREFCGIGCHSIEIAFFRKTSGKWQPIERIPREITYERSSFRYLGPASNSSAQSELLVDQLGAPLRSYFRDEAAVYRALLDSLYDFHGQRPRLIVIGGRHVRPPYAMLPQSPPIDSSTRAAYAFQSAIPDPVNPNFSYRIPTVIPTSDSLQALDVEGIPLHREAELKFANQETAGFWLAFEQHYPGAWGYVEFSRIGYNSEHTQALVFAAHNCGSACGSADVWLLVRSGEKWSVAARAEVPELSGTGWFLDSLRYLGKGADTTWYHPRRAHGVLTSAETGAILPLLDVTFTGNGEFRTTVKTNSAGEFRLENFPSASSLFFKVACPIPGRADTVAGEFLSMTRRGLDTTANLAVQFRGCKHLNRKHPLIAGTNPVAAAPPDSVYSSSDLAGVYRGVLDSLYPRGVRNRAAILLMPSPVGRCNYCIESEAPRLIRKGLLDPSTELNFADKPDTIGIRPFSYRIRIDTLTLWDRYWLAESGKVDWNAMKDAYPGITDAVSFLRVGFNNSRTEAMAEVYPDSAGANSEPETLLLKKQSAEWRVALRNVEREATSAEWSAGKCEPTDAPSRAPSRAKLERIAGDFRVVRVGAARAFRGRTDTLRVRLGTLRPSARNPEELAGSAALLDAKGSPDAKVAVSFEVIGDAATFDLDERHPPGVVQLDGWQEGHRILRVTGNSFFGTWYTVNGPTVPLKGYFCASRIE
jgi:hypothetical protein